VVRVHPDPPLFQGFLGALAQLGEHLLCKQGVVGSIPTGSTMERTAREINSTQKILKSSGIEAGVMFFENK
jgi:hypothetical protein